MDKKEAKIEKIYMLTPLQAGILAYTRLYGDSMYIVQKQISLQGKLDQEAINKTLHYLVKRYEVLRTFFVTSGVKEPVQAVLRERKLMPEYINVQRQTKEQQIAFIEDYLNKTRKKGFDLTKDILLRIAIVQTEEDKYELLWTLHHIILDGWSTGIILNDFIQIYVDVCNGRPIREDIRNQFDPYVKWIRSKNRKDVTFWKNYLADYRNNVSIEGKSIVSGNFQYHPDEMLFYLREELVKSLSELAGGEGMTLNLILETIWGVLLQKYNFADDVVYGYVSSGRNNELEAVEGIAGLTINTLPMRISTQEHDTFRMLANRVRQDYTEMQQNEFLSLADIQQESNLKSNLINHILVFENYPFDGDLNSEKIIAERGFKILGVDGTEQTNYGLNVVMIPGKELEIKFLYDNNIFSKENLTSVYKRLQHVCELVIANPDILIEDISICYSEEEEQIMQWSQNTNVHYPRELCIHEVFTRQAQKTPERIAASYNSQNITYQELDRQSSVLAVCLRNAGVTRDQLVGLCIEKSIEFLIGMLGILKAGGAYVPLDPDYPIDRIQDMLEQSEAGIVLTGQKPLPLTMVIRQICLTDIDLQQADQQKIDFINEAGDAAYVIFTSGTTGRPKGVLIEHKNVIRLLFNDKFQFEFSECDTWTMFHSVCFDFSVWEIYGALLYGGRLVMISKEQAKNTRYFLQLLQDEKVTVLNQVPSSLYNLIQFQKDPLPRLRYLITGGEALTPAKIMDWKKLNPHVMTINMYGITETTVHTTYKEIRLEDAEKEISNIGTPLPTLDVYIINNGNLCGVGIAGEICVAGEGLARGYVNNPDLTGQKFVYYNKIDGKRLYRSGDLGRWLPSGEIEYLGRADEQVKIRGFRIELKEIEQVLINAGQISNAVVLVKETANHEQQLCAFVVGKNVDFNKLKKDIMGYLPEYMIPGKFVTIDEIPVTRNGKADKAKLLSMEADVVRERVLPQTPTEKKLCDIYFDVLRVEDISTQDSFFELGGHSLTATIMEAKIRENFNVQIPLVQIFKTPSVKQLAVYIDCMSEGVKDSNKNEIQYKVQNAAIQHVGEKENYILSFYQENLWSTVQMGNDNGTLNIVLPLFFTNINLQILQNTLGIMIERHEALRTRIALEDGLPVQIICDYAEHMSNYRLIDLTQRKDQELYLEQLLQEENTTPFNLLTDSFLRMTVVKLNEEKHLLLLTIHHIISDAWSFDILFHDMSKIYNSIIIDEKPDLKPLPIRYVDFANWQKKQFSGRQRDSLRKYWMETLHHPLPEFQLKTDYTRPEVKDMKGESIDLSFDRELVNSIKKISGSLQASSFMILLTGVAILLYKYSGQKDIIIGTPIAGRENPQLENIVGYFLNLLPLRIDITNCNSIEDVIEKVKTTAIGAYEHQDYPFSLMLEDVGSKRNQSGSPLFDILVQQINTVNESKMKIGDAEMEIWQRKSTQSKYDLVFNFLENDSTLQLKLEFSTSLFKKETIERMLERYITIIKTIVNNSKALLSEISLGERTAIINIPAISLKEQKKGEYMQ